MKPELCLACSFKKGMQLIGELIGDEIMNSVAPRRWIEAWVWRLNVTVSIIVFADLVTLIVRQP